MIVDVIETGVPQAERTVQAIAGRMLDPTVAAVDLFAILEQDEQAIFDSLGGRYVETGRTRDSLTLSSSPDAIREAGLMGTFGGPHFTFGTRVWYAHFLTETIGPPSGKRGGMKRPQPNAVLHPSLMGGEVLGTTLLNYIVNGSTKHGL